MGAPAGIKTVLFVHEGDSARGGGGGTNLGRYAQMFLQPPKPNLVGWGSRSWNQAFRLSGRKWPPCSRVSRRPTPQIPKPAGPVIVTGVLTVARFVPHGNWRTPLLANSPSRGCWARRPCHSLVGPPGAIWVTPATWWEPRGTTSHTAAAMDPVHGSQWSVSSTDITLTAQQGAVLRSSYGSDGMGEVSTGTASMAFTGQRSQPMDATRQLLLVDDSAPGLSGKYRGGISRYFPPCPIPPWEIPGNTFYYNSIIFHINLKLWDCMHYNDNKCFVQTYMRPVAQVYLWAYVIQVIYILNGQVSLYKSIFKALISWWPTVIAAYHCMSCTKHPDISLFVAPYVSTMVIQYMAEYMKLLFIDMSMLLFLNSKTWFKMVFHLCKKLPHTIFRTTYACN